MKQIEIESLDKIDQAADEFLKFIKSEFPNSKCIIFEAGMGVGKTTFIKALCKAMGVKDEVSSPTFSIVNEYLCEDGSYVYHFDLYRIKDTEEAMAAGAEEYIYSNDYCFIEWPETLYPILPDDVITVKINEVDNGKRIMTIE